MKIKFVGLAAVALLALMACNKDDDSSSGPTLRDLTEVAAENETELQAYLKTHFYNYEEFENPPADFDYKIVFDTIAGDNANKTPLLDRPELRDTVIMINDVPQKMYMLIARQGSSEEHPLLGDQVVVKYEASYTNGTVQDASNIEIAFTTLNSGLRESFAWFCTKLHIGTGYDADNQPGDGTIVWNNDYGIGAVFSPAGLAYYESGNYNPYIFKIDMLAFSEFDQDQVYSYEARGYVNSPDGIPSSKEDLNGNGDPRDDDTDEDGIANYMDADDDNDGILTLYEYDVLPDNNNNGVVDEGDGDGVPDDSDGDGIPDYLDPDNQIGSGI